MKQRSICAFLVTLLLFSGAVAVEAAANPLLPVSSSSAPSTQVGTVPDSYLKAIKILQENKFGENEIKSFVYQIFSLFERHADVSNLLLLFADEDLFMRVPEGQVGSHQDFERWYAVIGAQYQSSTYTLERIDVQIPAKGDYRVDLIVLWQAQERAGKLISVRSHQQWKIVDGGGYWPRIVSYIVEPAK